MTFSLTALDIGCVLATLYTLKRLRDANAIQKVLPPGPPGVPVLGNMLNWPSSKEWETFAEWGRIYGEFILVSKQNFA
jgi:hypothetical protein